MALRVDSVGGLALGIGIMVDDYIIRIYDVDVAAGDGQMSLEHEVLAARLRREPLVMMLRIERSPDFWSSRMGGMGNWRDESVAHAVFGGGANGDMRGWIMPWQYHLKRLGIMDA